MMNRFWKFVLDAKYRFHVLTKIGLTNWMSDELFLKVKYKTVFKKKLNLRDPKTSSEKIQWLKLYDRKDVYTQMVDKFEAKKYVANKIGMEHIIPTLGVWERFEDIDFSKMPDQFVLKTTHDSGSIIICKDKKTFDREKARKVLEDSLKRNYYWANREWPYKNVKPRIIAEQYMVDESGTELKDYKFFCFKGKPQLLFVACDRSNHYEETKFNFYDMNFKMLPFTNGHPNAPADRIKKPSTFEQMKKMASVLSEGFPELRVDFYQINGCVYFGELTFYHWSGFMPFDPPDWDERLGDMIDLPNKITK